jgi:hypothetical protein
VEGSLLDPQAWEWKNFIKGEYGAIETKVYFSWMEEVIVCAGATLQEERVQHKKQWKLVCW